MLRKKHRKVCLLSVILFFLGLSCVTPFLVPICYAQKNVPISVSQNTAIKDRTAFYYRFSDYYGTHDWIADSAIRLILKSSYGDDWIWLLREDPYNNSGNPNDNIPFKDFDNWGIWSKPNFLAGSTSIRKWAANEDNILGDDLSKSGRNPGGRKWLHALRYTSLLHGTSIPDYLSIKQFNYKPSSLAIEKTGKAAYVLQMNNQYIPKTLMDYNKGPASGSPPILQRELSGIKFTNALVSSANHKVLFKEGFGKFIPDLPSHVWVADRAMEAGRVAVKMLTYMENTKESYTGTKRQHQPKYLMASICLGVLSHYIGDLSVPSHVLSPVDGQGCTNYKYNNHYNWEKWFADFPIFKSGDTATFPNGGPDWSSIDPRRKQDGYSNGLNRKELFPYPPWQATVDMGHITFTGWDPGNGFGSFNNYPNDVSELNDSQEHPYAAINMDFDPDVEGESGDPHRWGANLLKWAVYYTACSFLWVMNQVKKEEKAIGDTPADIENSLKSKYSSRSNLPHFTPLKEDWKDAYKGYQPESPHYDNAISASVMMGIMLSVGLLVPIIALVGIPEFIRGTMKQEKPIKVPAE